MADGDVKTKGTHLFLVDRTGAVPAIVKMVCPTGITGLTGGARDQIETTCLDDDERTYEQGLAGVTPITVPFNLKPSRAEHQLLWELKESEEKVDWLAALSESADPPTLGVDGVLIPPATRTSFQFKASVSDLAIDIATNEIVRGTLTLQRSGAPIPTWFVPA